MDRNQQLAALLEQAAARVTMLDAKDTAELNAFGEVLGQLNTLAAESSDADDTLKAFQQVSINAAQLIQQLVAAPDEKADPQIDAITAAVMEMQQLLSETAAPASQAAADLTAAAFAEDDIPLIQDFITESREHIEAAEAALLELENDPENNEVLNQIFRSFHTIKGMAGFLNLTDINILAHAAENLLDLARKGQLILANENSDAVFSSIDHLKGMLSDIEKALGSGTGLSRPSGLDALLDHLHACASGQACAVSPQKEDSPRPEAKPDETLDTLMHNHQPE